MNETTEERTEEDRRILEEGRLARVQIDTGKEVREKEERRVLMEVLADVDTHRETEGPRDSITEE